jgi:hypothetical protein
MDPPCNLDGFRAFLDGALRLHSGGGEHLVFLNTHLLSLPGTDYELAMECMRQNRLKLVELQRGYNRYSIPRLPRMFLSALLRVDRALHGVSVAPFFFGPAHSKSEAGCS